MKLDAKIFKEYDIRGKYPEQIDESFAYALGLSFSKLSKIKKIIVGRDARGESEKVFWALIAGLTKRGFMVDDIGICSTAELFFATGFKKHDLGIMITASHNPKGETGFKFCDNKGLVLGSIDRYGKIKQLINQELKKINKKNKFEPAIDKVKFLSIAKDYRDFALSFIDAEKIKGLKIVLDASNGSGGHLAEVVFNALPVKAHYINFKPNMITPDHGLNPLLEENRLSVIAEVKKNKANLGVIFDGDADRVIFVDEKGKFIEPYYINCLFAEIILAVYRNEKFLIDGRLGLLLSEIITKKGGKVLKHRSGYVNFIKLMLKNRILFGCENSGHFLLNLLLKKNNCFIWSDAIIPILLIAEFLRVNKLKLSKVIENYQKQMVISGEINFKNINFLRLANELKKKYSDNIFEEFDGLSVVSKDGDWFFNVRSSQTEPLVRLNIEAVSDKKVKSLKNDLTKIVKNFKL